MRGMHQPEPQADSPQYLDYRLLGPSVCMVASSYGLARYTYGLYIPVFRDALRLDDATLAFIAAVSYASYVLFTLLGIYLLRRISARAAVLLGGLFASAGMACIALAHDSRTLAWGVVIAGVSPGLAWTPFSEIVARHVQAPLQRRLYAVINAGTSVGVLLGGPLALFLGSQWRLAWACFAAFGLFSTLWCAWVLPGGGRPVPPPHRRGAGHAWWRDLASRCLRGPGGRLLVLSFGMGLVSSVYWAFAVDRVAHGSALAVWPGLDARQTSQLFWCLVGVAGLAGVFAGAVVERLGAQAALQLFLGGIALVCLGLGLWQGLWPVLLSGLLFGASFVLLSAALGLWSMEVFAGQVSAGFGLTYLLLSLGQFCGPLLVGLVIGRTPLATLFVAAGLLALAIALSLQRGARPSGPGAHGPAP